MKKSLFLLFLISLTSPALLAQTPLMYEQEALKRLSDKIYHSSVDSKTSDYPRDFKKNPLAFKDWYYGKINFRDNTEMDSMRFNYDFNVNAIVVQFNLDISAVSLKQDLVQSFTLYDNVVERKFIRKTKGDFKDIKYNMPFFEVLMGDDSKDTPTVLKQYQKELFSAEGQVNYGGEVAEDQYDFHAGYFIRTKGETSYRKFGLSKKKILGLFEKAKSKEVLAHVRSNNLKWSDEFEMIKVIRKYLQ
ncbi:MAG: hypothetical protein HEP71_34700 [Roseivirga sp.]|nr:hypothetical protein [Roseivirga sp.]